MIEGAGLILLGLVICGAAAFRWHHSSWSSPWGYAFVGLGMAMLGIAAIVLDFFI